MKHYLKASGKRYYKFLECTIGVPASLFTTRHVIDPISALYLKRNVLGILKEREVASFIQDLNLPLPFASKA